MPFELYKSKVKSYKCVYIHRVSWAWCTYRNIKAYISGPHFRFEFFILGMMKDNGSVSIRFFNLQLVIQY